MAPVDGSSMEDDGCGRVPDITTDFSQSGPHLDPSNRKEFCEPVVRDTVPGSLEIGGSSNIFKNEDEDEGALDGRVHLDSVLDRIVELGNAGDWKVAAAP
jgi:hypothetical protein